MKIKSETDCVEGVLLVQKIFPNGYKETVFEQKNVITLSSKQYLLSTIYQETNVVDVISNLRIGVGGTIDPEGRFPKSVNQNLTSLYTYSLTVPVFFSENVAVPSVTFIADLDQGSGNGLLITEAGLFKESGSMFNIKTFPGIPKTSEFSLHFEWTVKMV